MLCDEVPGARMQGSSKEGACDEVYQRVYARVFHEEVVEEDLGEDVEEVELGERDLVDHHGPQSVEEDLEGTEEGFAEDGIKEEGFEGGWEVGIEAIDAKGFVVGQVIGL